jgi:phenylacetate-CoA ligase
MRRQKEIESAPVREWLLRKAVLPLGDRAFGQRMMSRLAFLEKAQWWDRAEIAARRDKLLSALIRTAYEEVPFYRNLLRENSVTADDVQCVEDLIKIPVITKDMMRRQYPEFTTRPTGQKTYESRTSGSTGENFAVLEDRQTAGWYRASFLLDLEWAGWRAGQPHMQTGMTQRSMDRWLKDLALRCHYVLATDLSDVALDRHLEWLSRTKTRHLWGYPQSLYCLALRAQATGCDISLSSAVTWGDSVYPHYRRAIESAFDTRLFDTYGCAEGMQIAAQCGQDHAYHVHALDVIVEYLDDNMVPVVPGEPGNIVVTRLHPGPMPLIRYRVGDVGTGGGERACSCGRGFELMESIHGREADIITTPTGNRLIVHFFTGILEHYPEIETFQVVQETQDALVVRIVPREGYSDRVGRDLRQRLQEAGAADMSISIEPVEDVPLPPTGKRRFVISRLGKQTDPRDPTEPPASG